MSPQLKDTIDEYFVKNRFELIDFHMKGYFGWTTTGIKSYLNEWFNYEWPNLYGSKNFEETTFNPKFHYYFMGLKLISYKADIIRRVKRNRAMLYTDLIMLNYFNGIVVTPFPLTRKYWSSNVEKEYSNSDLIELIIKVIKNAAKWHNVKLDAIRVYKYIRWPADFKLLNSDLDKIDNTINKWILGAKIKIYNVAEKSTKKININIEPL